MNILFIHGNYPGQFRMLAESFGSQGQHDVRFLTARKDPENHPIAGLRVEQFEDVESSTCHPSPLLNPTEQAIRRGQCIQSKLVELAQQGFVPRLVIVHAGNGLGLLIRELIPDCCIIGYFEWYFTLSSARVLLNRGDLEARSMVSLRNLAIEHELLECDAAVVPTAWQAQQFPERLRTKLEVIFDGVDTQFFRPPDQDYSASTLTITGEHASLTLEPESFLLSYATRGMEPLRGFPEFMRALPAVLEALPNLKVLIGGRDRCAYSYPAPSHGGSWKEMLLAELGHFQGRDRLVFTGLLSYGDYRNLLYRTNLHCYFTRPYVTSWSLFEALACGTPLLTNRGDATTGTLPGLEDQAIDLELPREDLAAVMIERLQQRQSATAHRGSEPLIPEIYSRTFSRTQWQHTINQALQRRPIHTP